MRQYGRTLLSLIPAPAVLAPLLQPSMPMRSSHISLKLSVSMIFVLITANAIAQHFPEELTFPRASVEEHGYDSDSAAATAIKSDSSRTLHLSVDQTLFDKSYTGINNIAYSRTLGSVSLTQSLWYELRRDKLQNTRHYLNAAGSLEYDIKNARYAWVTPGLDWTPIVQHSSDRGGNNALTTIDIGPTAAFGVKNVPVALRAGISGRRVDSLAAALRFGDNRSSVGAYSSFEVGSEEELLPFAPFYFYAFGLGRQIENSSMASIASSALGALQIGERDSLFVYGAFTLFNGREGYLEGSADSRAALFTETPWRVERNITATAGYKAAQLYMFSPSAYYGVSENTLSFLNDARKRDEKTLRQTISGALETDSTKGLYYSGTLRFEWRDHDKLFGKTMRDVATPENIDSLDVNLWDYASFDPRTTHSIAWRLPWSMRLKYDFGLSRFLTEYPNYYLLGRDTVTNKDDSDRRNRQQRLSLEHKNDSSFRVEIYGELIDYDLVFLKQAKSSSNRTDNTQKIGLIVEWSPTTEFLITEALSAEAKKGTFHFPAFHQKALQRPRYSRSVNSSLLATWQSTPLVGFSGKWDIKLSDYGYWYGREYMEELLANDANTRVDYYAIASKSVYYTVDLSVNFRPWDVILEAGSAITSARDRHYSAGDYILTNEFGYSIKPYLSASISWNERIELRAHLSRTFVTGNDALGYWDIRLQAEGAF